jgi:hypothetical protein
LRPVSTDDLVFDEEVILFTSSVFGGGSGGDGEEGFGAAASVGDGDNGSGATTTTPLQPFTQAFPLPTAGADGALAIIRERFATADGLATAFQLPFATRRTVPVPVGWGTNVKFAAALGSGAARSSSSTSTRARKPSLPRPGRGWSVLPRVRRGVFPAAVDLGGARGWFAGLGAVGGPADTRLPKLLPTAVVGASPSICHVTRHRFVTSSAPVFIAKFYRCRDM